ncbi:MAG TPA: hypothetical protein VGQ22_15560 [Steroidobacteraceae bacterium]|nr:hypothetical protein [Steroidobacteraceae bacterium]
MSRVLIGTVTALSALAAAGCADTPSDADYGRSVNQMIQAQTYDPAAAANPPEQPPMTGDGARLENALTTYRGDTAKAGEVKREAEFTVGEK